MRREGSIDIWVMLTYLAIMFIGWTMVYATSFEETGAFFNLKTLYSKQLLFVGLALIAGTVILYVDTKLWQLISYVL